MEYYLIVSTVMMFVGIYGFVTRRNLLAMLISVELILNSVDINFVVFNRFLFPEQLEGFFFALFAIGISAAETAVAIAFSMEDAQRMCDFCQAYYGTGAGGFEEPLALAPAGYLLPFVNAQGERITLSLSTDFHQDPNMSQDHFVLAFNDLPSYDVSS